MFCSPQVIVPRQIVLISIFVVPNFLSAISLITYLGEGIPMPHLIIHGDKDQVVYYEQALIYLNKLIYPRNPQN